LSRWQWAWSCAMTPIFRSTLRWSKVCTPRVWYVDSLSSPHRTMLFTLETLILVQAFLLPTASNLPVVVLPAKFNSADPLRRLGIAFMSKPSFPLPPRPPTNPPANVASSSTAKEGADEASLSAAGRRKKKRRRVPQSNASAPVVTIPAFRRGHRRRETTGG
jgi:hypothetical protein